MTINTDVFVAASFNDFSTHLIGTQCDAITITSTYRSEMNIVQEVTVQKVKDLFTAFLRQERDNHPEDAHFNVKMHAYNNNILIAVGKWTIGVMPYPTARTS